MSSLYNPNELCHLKTFLDIQFTPKTHKQVLEMWRLEYDSRLPPLINYRLLSTKELPEWEQDVQPVYPIWWLNKIVMQIEDPYPTHHDIIATRENNMRYARLWLNEDYVGEYLLSLEGREEAREFGFLSRVGTSGEYWLIERQTERLKGKRRRERLEIVR